MNFRAFSELLGKWPENERILNFNEHPIQFIFFCPEDVKTVFVSTLAQLEGPSQNLTTPKVQGGSGSPEFYFFWGGEPFLY